MLQVTRNCNTAEWDNFVNQHPSGNILQLFAWAEAKLPAWDSEIVVLREEGKIIAGAQILLAVTLSASAFFNGLRAERSSYRFYQFGSSESSAA